MYHSQGTFTDSPNYLATGSGFYEMRAYPIMSQDTEAVGVYFAPPDGKALDCGASYVLLAMSSPALGSLLVQRRGSRSASQVSDRMN